MSVESRLATLDRVAEVSNMPLLDYMQLRMRVEANKTIDISTYEIPDGALSGMDLSRMKVPTGLVAVNAITRGTTTRLGGYVWRFNMTRVADGYAIGAVSADGKVIDALPQWVRDYFDLDPSYVIRLITKPDYVEHMRGLSGGASRFVYVYTYHRPYVEPDYGKPPAWNEDAEKAISGTTDQGDWAEVSYTVGYTRKGKWWSMVSTEGGDFQVPNHRTRKSAMMSAKDDAYDWLYNNGYVSYDSDKEDDDD